MSSGLGWSVRVVFAVLVKGRGEGEPPHVYVVIFFKYKKNMNK